MYRPRPWVVAGVRGAVVLMLAGAISAAAVHRDPSPVRMRRALSAAPLAGLDRLASAVLAAAVSQPEPPAPPPPPPAIVWPGPGAVTGWFGESRATHRHMGVDLQASTGSRVVAAAAGTVTIAGPAPAGLSGYGTIVVINHGDGITTMYAHLSRVAVRPRQFVAPGDLVGAAGSTGQVTSPHLHFEVRRNGAPFDPRRWLPPR